MATLIDASVVVALLLRDENVLIRRELSGDGHPAQSQAGDLRPKTRNRCLQRENREPGCRKLRHLGRRHMGTEEL